MMVDDENSVYVGGFPYDSTEDSLRRALEVYGTIIAVKIVNDREFGGKCYGFVTFTNPRSAVNAINDMDGRTIGGRVVRVNEVRSKSSRSAFGRDNFFRDRYRDQDRDRERPRERDRDRDADRDRDRDADRDRDRDRDLRFRNRIGAARRISPLRDQKLSPRTFHTAHRRSLQRHRSRSPRGRSPSGSSSDGKHHASLSPSPRKSERMQLDENSGRHKLTITSNDTDLSKVREELDKAIQSRDELKHKVVRLEEEFDNKRLSISELQKKSQRLEESLAAARMASFQRKMHLRKLQKCFLQVKDYSERLKSSEQELQLLVDASVLEMNGLDEGAGED